MDNQFTKLKKLLISHQNELVRLGTRHLAIFGSTVREEATKASDVDILVEFDVKRGLFGFADLKFYLEEILQRHVDLVTKQGLRPELKKRILNEAKQVF